ncbi:MAG TPA: bacillithiol biosynthesis BshC, partial [Agriterribacter sp.]|nr:bacillithiol biosynthesis BshC [Agriterribacter sp.]
KLQLSAADLFKDQSLLLDEVTRSQSNLQLTLERERSQLAEIYSHVREVAGSIDSTLTGHVNALEARAERALKNLEKKMIRAEKKKYAIQSAQIEKLKLGLFPRNTLQERVENILPYYARYGQAFIDMLYKHSPALGKQFGVLIKDS